MTYGLSKLTALYFAIILIIITIHGFAGANTTSANASALAIGNETTAYTHTNITDNVSSAVAVSEAKAENGSTATAEAQASGNWFGNTIAYAIAKATVISKIGETMWAQAIARVLVSANGTASSYSQAVASDKHVSLEGDSRRTDFPIDYDPPAIQTPPPTIQTKPNIIPTRININTGFAGYNFGGSSVERYCIYKVQLSINNDTLKYHANYYMDIIINEDGFYNRTKFEKKYNLTDINCANLILYGHKANSSHSSLT
jgi:hypothetical protein